MVNICLTCGDIGFSDALIFCNKCEVYSMHLYCLAKIPSDFDDVVWLCEDCESKARKLSSLDKCSPDSESFGSVQEKKKSNRNVSAGSLNRSTDPGLEKSSSLQLDLENINKDQEYERHNGLADKSSMAEAVQSLESKNAELDLGECQELEMNCSDEGEKDEKHGKRVVLEEAESLKINVTKLDGQGIVLSEIDYCKDAENQQLVITHSPDIVEQTYVPAQPIEQPVWRGHFSISDELIDGMLGLVAHLSNIACPRVGEEAKSLPLLLSSELLPRSTLWPKSFAKWGPSDDSIALYFFPDSESSERIFDSLVKDMIDRDLGLRAVLQNAELLVFTSTLMPMDYWRFQAKYYLWGVFKAKKSRRSAAKAVPGEVKGIAQDSDRHSPISPLSNGSNGFGSPLASLSQSMLR